MVFSMVFLFFQVPDVQVYGALFDIMKKGDISAKTHVKPQNPGTYGLGALEDLKGEFIIIDGEMYSTQVREGKAETHINTEFGAALAVISEIHKWRKIPNAHFGSVAEFEAFLLDWAQKRTLDSPFFFQVRGVISSADWHIVNWDKSDLHHTHEKHIHSGLRGKIEGEEVHIVGVFSKNHKGIFTHHTTNLHMHVLFKNVAAHVDSITFGPNIELFLPEILFEMD